MGTYVYYCTYRLAKAFWSSALHDCYVATSPRHQLGDHYDHIGTLCADSEVGGTCKVTRGIEAMECLRGMRLRDLGAIGKARNSGGKKELAPTF